MPFIVYLKKGKRINSTVMKSVFKYSQYRSIVTIIEYLKKTHIQEIERGKLSVNWEDITQKYRLNPELTNEICLMFLIYHYLFRQVFNRNLEFSKTIAIISKIEDMFKLRYYGNTMKFLSYILICSLLLNFKKLNYDFLYLVCSFL